MTRSAPGLQRLIIGSFLFLAAVACAVAPLPLAFRSGAILFVSFLAYAGAGTPAAHLTALLAPAAGLISGDPDWLVMLPIVLASNLLALIGLELAWRYGALVVAPVLQAVPQLFVWNASRQELFAVTLPWESSTMTWIVLHALTTLAGVLIALYLDRRHERKTAET